MSGHRSTGDGSPLVERLEALREATELGVERLPDALIELAVGVLDRASTRRSLSADHTVVGFFGATGSGKSSLFNAVIGRELARTAATRPTTNEPLAGVWQAEGSAELLDWLQVGQRNLLEEPLGSATTGFLKQQNHAATGLILLDLPDFDSTTTAHRATVERLAGQVDVLVWVLDPQKYADAAVHEEFIRPLAAYAGVTLVVLNQIDRLRPADRDPVVDSLRGILESDGLRKPRIHVVSALTGEGVEELRRTIARVAVSRSASAERLSQDVAHAATALGEASGGSTTPRRPSIREPGAAEQRHLAEQLAQAAGVETVVSATRASYRLQATARTGWPVTRWIGRLRPDPLRRLNLRRRDVSPSVNRTSLPGAGAVQRAQSAAAVRAFADQASTGAPDIWRSTIRRAARSTSATLPDSLDQAIAATDISAGKGSWWWPVIGILQWFALAVAVAGAAWLGALALAGYLQFDVSPAPTVEGFPVPTLLLAGGLLLGIVLAAVSGLCARVAAVGRARAARRKLHAAISNVVQGNVVEPTLAEIHRFNAFVDAIRRARG